MNSRSILSNILFLDIETVPQYPSFQECPPGMQKHWEHKAGLLRNPESASASELYSRAGIYAEFGKIVCVSTGWLEQSGDVQLLRIRSFFGDDELLILQDLAHFLETNSFSRLCAHNGKEFDFPYLSRRMVIHEIHLPVLLDNAGKKPWEMHHLDTMELWKFGDFKSYTPLNLLTYVLGIESPKDDIDGSQVAAVYWMDNNLSRIVTYCEKDIRALVNVFLKMKGVPLIAHSEC